MKKVILYVKSWFDIVELSKYRNLIISSLTVCFFTLAFRYHRVSVILHPYPISNRLMAALVAYGGLCFLIPLATIPFLRSEERRLGLRLGNVRRWSFDLLVAYSVILALILIFARGPDFMRTYPLYKPAIKNWTLFVKFELAMMVYMFGWEFLFRGYYLFAIKKETGVAVAIVIQMLPFAFLHIGKPELEVYGSVLAGIALGMLAIRANSFLPCAILHFLASFTMDIVSIISHRIG